MTPQEMLLYFNLALGSLALLGHLKSYLSSGEKVITKELKALTEALTELTKSQTQHDLRIQKLENDMAHLPSKDEVNRMWIELAKLTGSVGELAAEFKGVSNTVHNIDNWLRERGGK